MAQGEGGGAQLMSSATVQINVVPKRLLKKGEAASYCGRSVKRFEAGFPYPPVRMPNGDLLYDVHDLDKWVDSLKAGAPDCDVEDIVARLGK
jgi:hypothetical protein